MLPFFVKIWVSELCFFFFLSAGRTSIALAGSSSSNSNNSSSSNEFLLFFPSDKSITCLNSVWTLWTERGQRKQVFPVNKQKKKNVKSFQNTVILGCGKSTIKHFSSSDFFSFELATTYRVCKISFPLTPQQGK